MNILLGVTGSVSASLTPKLVTALKKLGAVRVVMTEAGVKMAPKGKHIPPPKFPGALDGEFLTPAQVIGVEGIYTDCLEWPLHWPSGQKTWTKGDPVLHIDLKNWADILVIAPCTANTLAKIANGLADNLLTNIVRAWPEKKPLFIAPAMNTDMWEQPVTNRHLNRLDLDFNLTIIQPQEKVLACGDKGCGALAEISDIVSQIKETLRWDSPLSQKPYIPAQPHPGAFGTPRKHDIHTGVDLYVQPNSYPQVSAVEPGVIVGIIDFTGSKVLGKDGKPMSWWKDTKAVLVKGASGVVVYGEIEPNSYLKVGDWVSKGALIGEVVPVLPSEKIRKDIPHHSNRMLHIELYESVVAEKNFRWGSWGLDAPKPEGLLDPTPLLKDIPSA